MSIPDHTHEFPPARSFREDDQTTLYWILGDTILYCHYPLKGADVDSFAFHLGSFVKDHKHCYCTSTRLAGGNGTTFRALNYTYATDGTSVWTVGGKIKDANAASFVVCDEEVHYLGSGSLILYGFGKEKNTFITTISMASRIGCARHRRHRLFRSTTGTTARTIALSSAVRPLF